MLAVFAEVWKLSPSAGGAGTRTTAVARGKHGALSRHEGVAAVVGPKARAQVTQSEDPTGGRRRSTRFIPLVSCIFPVLTLAEPTPQSPHRALEDRSAGDVCAHVSLQDAGHGSTGGSRWETGARPPLLGLHLALSTHTGRCMETSSQASWSLHWVGAFGEPGASLPRSSADPKCSGMFPIWEQASSC